MVEPKRLKYEYETRVLLLREFHICSDKAVFNNLRTKPSPCMSLFALKFESKQELLKCRQGVQNSNQSVQCCADSCGADACAASSVSCEASTASPRFCASFYVVEYGVRASLTALTDKYNRLTSN